jgi:hypothetical protein
VKFDWFVWFLVDQLYRVPYRDFIVGKCTPEGIRRN